MPSVGRHDLKGYSKRVVPTPGILEIVVLCSWLAACGSPPRARMEVRVTSDGPKAATVCPAPSPGVVPGPGCEPFELVDMSKLVVKPGDAVALTGKNFRSSMTAATSAALSEMGPKVTVLSDTKAALLIPEKASFGLMDVTLTQDGVTQKVTLLSNGGKTDYPVFTAGADQICQGTKFYDLAGVLQEGTKNCALAAEVPACQTDGQVGCITTKDTPAIVKSAIDPTNVRSGVSMVGVIGTLAGTPSPCSLDGETGCLANASFKAVDSSRLTATNIKTGVILGGVTGSLPSTSLECSIDGQTGCLTNAAFKAADMSLAVTANIKSGVVVAGITGTLTTPPTCSASGSQSCVASGTYYAAQACLASGSSGCYLPQYVFTTQPLMAVNLDAVDTTKIRSSLTIAGRVGSLSDCATDGLSGCVTTATYKSADLTNLSAGNIKNGVNIAGTVGTYPSVATPLAANTATPDLISVSPTTPVGAYEFFDSAGDVRPVAVADGGTVTPSDIVQNIGAADTIYRAVTIAGDSNFQAANIRSGTSIFGVAGSVTAESHSNCSTNGAQGCVATGSYYAGTACAANSSACYIPTYASGTQPLLAINYDTIDATNMRAALTIGGKSGSLGDCATDGALGCVTMTGFPSARLANFTASNVQSGTTIAGVAGTIPSCTSDGQTECVSSALLPAANISGFSTWNLRIGTTLGGVTGTLKTNCRNTVTSSKFNYDGTVGSLPNTAEATGTSADYWDTIDDVYGFPSTRVAAWTTDTLCDSNTWADKTTTNGGSSFTTCGTSSTCIYQDKISNLQVTGILASGGNTTNTTTPATYAWNEAVQICASSTYGGYAAGSWRLPTQKELMSLYEHGIASLAGTSFITFANMNSSYFWSSSTNSSWTPYAWYVYLAYGYTYNDASKTSSTYVVCVR